MSLTKITENEYQSQEDPNERKRDSSHAFSPGMASTQNTGAYKGDGKAHSPLLHYASRETNETKHPSSDSFGGIVCFGNN
jgi:hypothetical protein